MAICKCKMCGGDLNITELDKVVECEYCGTTQTVPSADNEKKMTLFNRANRLRSNNEFDKAAALYEQLVAEFPEEAEAYWGLCLCNYGIEYVDDPATGKKIPTCHRASFEKLSADENFSLAMEYADVIAQRQYRAEAREIDRINEEILSVSRNETPYDIFICYKETDENGNRTVDSVMAQDIYDALTAKGYKVFFSRISLEDKLGQQYEPYIFAALNSAKIMLSVGTKYEYFHAVWVKNEWSRFMRLAAKDKSKTLIPCYKDMDPYDMPDVFQALQGQDLGKLGAIQDLVRGVEKLLPKDASPAQPSAPAQVVVANPAAATVESLLKRAFMFLEDGNWQSADEYAEKVLDIDPENGEAYLAKAMAELEVKNRAMLSDAPGLEKNANAKKALRFGSESLKNEINGYIITFKEAAQRSRKETVQRLSAYREKIHSAQQMITGNAFNYAGLRIDGTVVSIRDYDDTKEWKDVIAIAMTTNSEHTFGLRKDGRVLFKGSYYQDGKSHIIETEAWTDIIAIDAGEEFVVALKADGTVIAAGNNEYGQCNTENWTDIIAIAAGYAHTVGLKADGTVVSVGFNENGACNTDKWSNVKEVMATDRTIGIKTDGTIVCTGQNEDGECNTQNWTNIVAVAAGDMHTVGLKADGTVVAVGYNERGECITEKWKNIVNIAAGDRITYGLKADGTVVAAGLFDDVISATGKWTDVIAIKAAYTSVIGLKSDGSIVSAGFENYMEYNPAEWKLFQNYETIQEERIAAEKHAEEKRIVAEKRAEDERIAAEKRVEEERQAKIAALTKGKNDLEAELPTLKGLFKGNRRKEAEVRLAEIEAELKKLQS